MRLYDWTMDFLAHLPQIEAVIQSVCRRHHCGVEEAEEFAAEVKARLIADDYAVIRKFKGKSSFETYLTTVVQRHYLDWRNHLWGKWRPSAEARRLGPVGVRLEELARDGYSFDESCDLLRTNYGVTQSAPELAKLAARLPPRLPRRIEGEESLEELLCTLPLPDDHVLAKELRRERRRILAILGRAMQRLSEDDRILIRLRFQTDHQIALVAIRRGVEPKRLYRRLERILRRLRRMLEREGVSSELVTELLRAGDPSAGED